MRVCANCKIEKDDCLFGKHRKSKDGINTECKKCNTDRAKEWSKNNLERSRLKAREWQSQNPEKTLARSLRWAKKNPEKVRASQAKWEKANPGYMKAKKAKRRTAEILRIPKWANLKAIQEFYNLCPEGYEVDHIIPLRGKNVSGLHVLENLQYLTKKENALKGNKYGT